jgi:hypothetical protein
MIYFILSVVEQVILDSPVVVRIIVGVVVPVVHSCRVLDSERILRQLDGTRVDWKYRHSDRDSYKLQHKQKPQ